MSVMKFFASIYITIHAVSIYWISSANCFISFLGWADCSYFSRFFLKFILGHFSEKTIVTTQLWRGILIWVGCPKNNVTHVTHVECPPRYVYAFRTHVECPPPPQCTCTVRVRVSDTRGISSNVRVCVRDTPGMSSNVRVRSKQNKNIAKINVCGHFALLWGISTFKINFFFLNVRMVCYANFQSSQIWELKDMTIL